ncbi:MAG: glycosyltransferase family 39 protein [Spirochaetota bacterium]
MMFTDENGRELSVRELVVWGALYCAGIFLLLFRITHEGVWYDESYTIAAVRNSFGDMVGMIARDSHPPLYFLLLKSFTLVFGESVFVFRLFSALAVFLLALVGFTHIRRLVSNSAGLIYAVLVFVTPISIFQAQETRMYSWCGALVMVSFVFIFEWWKNGSMKNWIAGALCAYAAALTHYYGLIAVTVMYGVLTVYALVTRREAVVRILVTCAALVILYTPVFFMLAYQASRISGGFWIQPMPLWRALTLFTYFYGYKFEYPVVSVSHFATLFAMLLAGGGAAMAIRRRKTEGDFALVAASVFFLTVLAGFVLSIIIRPILIGRYITAVLGPFLFLLTYAIHSLKKKVLISGAVVVYTLLTVPVLYGIYMKNVNGPMETVHENLKERVAPDDIFLHGSEHTMGTFCYYFPENRHYLYIPEGHNAYSNYEVFRRYGEYGSDYEPYLESHRGTVWVTNRPGDPTSLPVAAVASHPHWMRTESTERYGLPDSWYGVHVDRFLYTEEKEETGTELIGSLEIVVRGIEGQDAVYWAVFDSDPISESNISLKGMGSPEDGRIRITLADMAYGSYAVFCWQDRDGDINWDHESEGVAFFGELENGELTFASNSADFSEGKQTHEIRMVYPD